MEFENNLKSLMPKEHENSVVRGEVNNHVHSSYSFSPYSPTNIVSEAVKSGLQIVGLMDHDTVAGAEEFLDAGKRLGIATTIGCEIRVRLDINEYKNKHINNPDETNIIYIAIHGIPKKNLESATSFLKPIRLARKNRMQLQTKNLNTFLEEKNVSIKINFHDDVLLSSNFNSGGTITERHILYAFSKKLVQKFGKGEKLLSVIENNLVDFIDPKIKGYLCDTSNPHYIFDLLGLLKSSLVPKFFIPSSSNECPSVNDVIPFAKSIDAIPAYAYLGDVNESPTKDKKTQKFEDAFLENLLDDLKKIGFQAITYMPPRNSNNQLSRLRLLCKKYNFMEISGVDINSSRQSFNCPILLEKEFDHLIDAAWALVAHEKLSEKDPPEGLFNYEDKMINMDISSRIKEYADIGRSLGR